MGTYTVMAQGRSDSDVLGLTNRYKSRILVCQGVQDKMPIFSIQTIYKGAL